MSIKVERVKAGKSANEVCEHMGVSRVTLNNWESGKGFPRADKLPKLASFLGCTVDELLAPAK